jgi:hypothetical protein
MAIRRSGGIWPFRQDFGGVDCISIRIFNGLGFPENGARNADK